MINQQLVIADQTRINQSKIKRLREAVVCPHKYYREEVTGEYRRKTSEAMLKGQYFEYSLYGTLPKDGGIPVLEPLKKSGKPSTDQMRIDAWVQKYPAIIAELGIKPAKTDMTLEWTVEGVQFHGTTDVLVEWQGKPYIMDLKLTASVQNTFGGAFAWGTFNKLHPKFIHMKKDEGGVYIADYDREKIIRHEAYDPIQAHAYMHLLRQYTKREWGFLYAVFDYKKNPEYKFIEVPYNKQANADMLQDLRDTKYKLNIFNEMGYAAIPSASECEKCPVEDCKLRYIKPPEAELIKFDDDQPF